MCYDEFVKMKLIQPLAQLAQFRCQSLFYEKMFIFATPQNNKTECGDESDESRPKDYSTILIITSTLIITTLYISLKYSGLAKRMLSSENQNLESNVEIDHNRISMYQNYMYYNNRYLENYRENHDQNEAITSTNIHILNSIHTQKVDNNIDTCKLFYQLEQDIHRSNQSEIHLCLHKKLDPKVVENILDSGEPGCTPGCIKNSKTL